MAVTPMQALELSPAAKLTPEELRKVEELERKADEVLTTKWDGGSDVEVFTQASPKVLSEFCRRFARASWVARYEPVRARRNPAGVKIDLSEREGYTLTLMPLWPKA